MRCAICKLAKDQYPFQGMTFGEEEVLSWKEHEVLKDEVRYRHVFHTYCWQRWDKKYDHCPVCKDPRLSKFAIKVIPLKEPSQNALSSFFIIAAAMTIVAMLVLVGAEKVNTQGKFKEF